VVRSRDGLDATGRTAATAALRETFEEMGLLLAVHADGSPATQADVDALDRHAPLWPQLRARGLRLDVAQLWQIGHFTADRNLPKRFAVPFLWPACRPARHRSPTTASSSSPSGCSRPRRWSASRPGRCP
jgi:8-oxo-dGTP pyrophosphatase MutT (NUDIX family)